MRAIMLPLLLPRPPFGDLPAGTGVLTIELPTRVRADALALIVDNVEITHLYAVGAIPGVAPRLAAARNGPGTGRIASSGDGSLLSWRAPGSNTFGPPLNCGADGEYLLCDGEDRQKWLRVEVFRAQLSTIPTANEVALQDVWENGTADVDVTAAEAAAGDVLVYAIRMENAGTVILSDLRLWIDAAVSGLEISDDGVTWVSPTGEVTALIFADLARGASHTLYLRRTITASADSDADVLVQLHLSFHGL